MRGFLSYGGVTLKHVGGQYTSMLVCEICAMCTIFFPPTLIGLLVYFQEVWSDRSVCVCVCATVNLHTGKGMFQRRLCLC